MLFVRLAFVAAVVAAAVSIAPHVDQLADDRRMAWAALLPLVYVVGMMVLLKE